MAEKKILVFDKEFSYEGLFKARNVYREARNWLSEHGYSPYEYKHEEQIFEEGKQIYVELQGDKKLSDYAKISWISKLTFSKIKDVKVDQDEKSITMNKGKVRIVTMLISSTDWDNTFEQNPFQYFLRVVIEKYIFKGYISKAEKRAKVDYATYEEKLKSYLNMNQFR